MFRTELTIAPATGQLPRTARVLTMGSCFADSIGLRLAAHKVDTLANPFGTVFQPLALGRLLRAAAGEEVDWQQHLVQARGRWQSYDLHGSIGADSPVVLLQTIQELVRRTGEFLRRADVVLLTLGTAWAYRLRETGELVNNCHKQSADLFVRELLTPDDIINGLAETHAYLRRINPELRFVLTVSPVRHLKDTLPLNTVSKSVLRVATHFVSDLLPGVAYFPAYELLLDDLRDYRFYTADMLHPSEVAEDYVWEKFTRTYFDADFGRFRKEWTAVRQSLSHRPLHPGAPEHRQFLDATREKLEQLSLRKVDVAAELSEVRSQLAALPVVQQPEPTAAVEDDEERIDIGEGSTKAGVDAFGSPTALGDGRPPRLSPEEFRAQRAARPGRPERGRRDGRGRNQVEQPAENEQFQAPPVLANDLIEPAQAFDIEKTDLTDAEVTTADGEDPIKKKKRRSRGGAKRTARKNALLLAAGELLPGDELTGNEAETDATDQDAVTENRLTPPEGDSAGKRSGRRNEPGRMPRKELFATAEAPISAAARPMLDAELPTPTAGATAPVAVSALLGSLLAADSTATDTPDSRNNRNRNNRGSGRTETVNSEFRPAQTTATQAIGAMIGSAEQLSGAPEAGNDPTFDRPAKGIQSSAFVNGATDAPTASETGVAPVAARSSGRPRRAVSAARAEKPAIDTPVVPVADPRLIRTQVAAGRMTGSSASLIPPTAAVVKPVAVVIPTVTKQKQAVTKVKAAKVEVTPVAPVVVPVAPAPVTPAAVSSPAQLSAPSPKTKSAARSKASVVAKASIPETVVPEAAMPTAKAPKRGAAKSVTPKPATPKPAPLKKLAIKAVVAETPVPEIVVAKITAAPKAATVKPAARKATTVKAATTEAVISKPAAKKLPVAKPASTKPVPKVTPAKPATLKASVSKPRAVKAAVPKPEPATKKKVVPKPLAPTPATPEPAPVKPKKPAKPA